MSVTKARHFRRPLCKHIGGHFLVEWTRSCGLTCDYDKRYDSISTTAPRNPPWKRHKRERKPFEAIGMGGRSLHYIILQDIIGLPQQSTIALRCYSPYGAWTAAMFMPVDGALGYDTAAAACKAAGEIPPD